MENLTGVENQECQQCPEGTFIAESNNPQYVCYMCPASAECPNGALPQFKSTSVQGEITLEGLDYDVTQEAMLVQAIAEALGIDPAYVEISGVCIQGSDSTSGLPLCDDSRSARRRMLWLQEDNQRSLLQSGGLRVSFKVPSLVENADQVAGAIRGSSFLNNVTSSVSKSANVPVTVALDTNAVQVEPKILKGEEFIMRSGAPFLLDCAPGHLLVNNSINSQDW
eukprot:3000935-Rhodomonas_salina.4